MKKSTVAGFQGGLLILCSFAMSLLGAYIGDNASDTGFNLTLVMWIFILSIFLFIAGCCKLQSIPNLKSLNQ